MVIDPCVAHNGRVETMPHLSPGELERLSRAPELKVYKKDGRSRVWSAACEPRAVVFKRFEFWPLRQWVIACLGLHPMQREMRRIAVLEAAGVDVAPIVGRGSQPAFLGRRYWLATAWCGESVFRHIRQLGGGRGAKSRAIVEGMADITSRLFEAGLIHRDHRVSNMLLDDAGRLRLVDVDGVRRSTDAKDRIRTLGTLASSAKKAGATRTDFWRFLLRITELSPSLGDARDLARRIRVE